MFTAEKSLEDGLSLHYRPNSRNRSEGGHKTNEKSNYELDLRDDELNGCGGWVKERVGSYGAAARYG